MSRPVSVSKSSRGIEIREALDILALRSRSDNHKPDEHTDCQHGALIGGDSMGQRIDLEAEASIHKVREGIEERMHELAEARRHREAETRANLSRLCVEELVAAIQESQRGRVSAYRQFNEGLEIMLQRSNILSYPAICAEATASFSFLSKTVNMIQCILQDEYYRQDLADLVVALQKHEGDKLQLTAALHLERIRVEGKSNPDQVGNTGASALLNRSVLDLRDRLSQCVEAINDVLEELRYALVENSEVEAEEAGKY